MPAVAKTRESSATPRPHSARWRDQSIATRLTVAFAAVGVVIAVVGVLGLGAFARLRDNLTTMYGDYTAGAIHLSAAASGLARYRNNVFVGMVAANEDAYLEVVKQQPDLQRGILGRLDRYGAHRTFRTSSQGLVEKDYYDRYRAALEDYFKASDLTLKMEAAVWKAAGENDASLARRRAQVNDQYNAGPKLMEAFTSYDSLLATVDQLGAAADHSGRQAASTGSRALVVGTLVAVLLSVLFGRFMAVAVARPLREAGRMLDQVARGDYSQKIESRSNDEVGLMIRSLDSAVASVRTAFGEVRSVARQLTGASTRITAGAETIATGAQEAAGHLEETAASLTEVTSAAEQTAHNAEEAKQFAYQSQQVAEKGGVVVGSAVKAMSEINASSRRIADIISTIDEIAFQTNLLALNAAVEAARAGEQGRGFAVVAAEVRSLAQRSATAAREIKTLISDSVGKVESGSSLVNQSGDTLQEILRSAARVRETVAQIADASHDQSCGLQQIQTAISQLDLVVQNNQRETDHMHGTAGELAVQAEILDALVGRFRLESGPAPVRSVDRVAGGLF